MRILLKLHLDCQPDAAWAAITSPGGLRAVSAPLLSFQSLEAEGFPEQWTEGAHRVRLRALGILPVGDQTIDLSFGERPDGEGGTVRIVRDTGRGLSWPLTVTRSWDHRMAVSASPRGGTLYRDQLRFRAGMLGPLLWPGYWAFWQCRARGLRRLLSSSC